MHPDHISYFYLASRTRLKKSLNTVAGVIEGIAIDGVFTPGEISFLNTWLGEHNVLRTRHPYNEIIPAIEQAMADGLLSDEERLDILWLCDRLAAEQGYIDSITPSIQRLHGILAGIIADGEIRHDELKGLRVWLEDNTHLKTCWPYDEIDSLVAAVMADQRIYPEEHSLLLQFFLDFVTVADDRTISNPPVMTEGRITGLCACCPEITFTGSLFCFTGASSRYTRSEISEIIQGLGGQVSDSISRKTDYLVIGAEGNPCWAYACYGRKVERASGLRREGGKILIVHENDLHDAIADTNI